MENQVSRRECLGVSAALAATTLANPARGAAATGAAAPTDAFTYGLNTSTVRGQKLAIAQVAELAAKAGFRAIEPWIRELDDHVKGGGSLPDLGKRFRDLGLEVVSAIGFFDWVVDDEARRKKGLDEARRNLEMVRAIGGARLAAPPSGATDRADLDLNKAAERYRALLELGDEFGVVPQVEVWGFSRAIGNLADAARVAIGSGHPKACILTDVYHLYKGGSGFDGIRLLSGQALQVVHMNDYPANPPRATITDADRVYPGDGVAPLGQILRDLHAIGFRGALSVELFNRRYYEQDAFTVLRVAREKLDAQVRAAFA